GNADSSLAFCFSCAGKVISSRGFCFSSSGNANSSLGQEYPCGLHFISVSESIDTSTPVGKMIITVLGALAELERNLIKECVHMGISRTRKQGSALGR